MFQLPTEANVRDLLSMMVGKDVAVKYSAMPLVDAATTGAIARYDDDEGVLRALASCDLLVANSLGAALALVPKGRVMDAVKGKTVPADFADNLHEVFNVGANFFNAPDRPHVRLSVTHTPPDLPAELLQSLRSSPTRLDLKVDVPGYGSGTLTVVAVA